MPHDDLTFLATGDWGPGQVDLTWTDRSGRRVVSEVERIIDETWARVSSRRQVHLFDGPMCRMESFEASPARLSFQLSSTSYKPFLGTNLENPHLAREYGRAVMANPLGVSTLLETVDGHLLLGVRNGAVAYYPNRIHPFAGALEPRDAADAFAAACRELEEEVAVTRAEVTDLRCVGLVEDAGLLQPELIFLARTQLTQSEVARRLDPAEHNALMAVPANREPIRDAMAAGLTTPVARASLSLWGRARLGLDWLDDAGAFPGPTT